MADEKKKSQPPAPPRRPQPPLAPPPPPSSPRHRPDRPAEDAFEKGTRIEPDRPWER